MGSFCDFFNSHRRTGSVFVRLHTSGSVWFFHSMVYGRILSGSGRVFVESWGGLICSSRPNSGTPPRASAPGGFLRVS